MTETTDYKSHIFVQYGVSDIREALTGQEKDYPYLTSIDDELVDGILYHCWRKGYVFWTGDSELDLEELERLAVSYGNGGG